MKLDTEIKIKEQNNLNIKSLETSLNYLNKEIT
jgi:hypothetical protein